MRVSVTGPLAIAAVMLAGVSQASPIFSISGGVSLPAVGNDFLWVGSNLTAGGMLGLSERARVTVEYIGKEAGFPGTEFWFGALSPPGGTRVVATNSGLPVTEGSTPAASYPPPGIPRNLAPYETLVDPGPVPFYFRVPGSGNAIVPNGGSQTGMGDIAFWWKPSAGPLADVVYLMLDDGGGFNPGEPSDNDYDDMIVRLTAVPEPATGVLTLLGLGVVGVTTRWRRRTLRDARARP